MDTKYFKHFKVITLHKYYVMVECFKRGLYYQGIMHDLSKYSFTEFFESARYFQGTETPINKIKRELGYSKAWLNHKGKNKHHWEYWTDFYEGKVKAVKIPYKYIVEMACDMIGASKAYLKYSYNNKEPLNYFLGVKDKMLMLVEDKYLLQQLLEEEANK